MGLKVTFSSVQSLHISIKLLNLWHSHFSKSAHEAAYGFGITDKILFFSRCHIRLFIPLQQELQDLWRVQTAQRWLSGYTWAECKFYLSLVCSMSFLCTFSKVWGCFPLPLNSITFCWILSGFLRYGHKWRWLDSDPEAQDRPDFVQSWLEAVQEWIRIHPRRLLAGQWAHLPFNKAAQYAQDRDGGMCWKTLLSLKLGCDVNKQEYVNHT